MGSTGEAPTPPHPSHGLRARLDKVLAQAGWGSSQDVRADEPRARLLDNLVKAAMQYREVQVVPTEPTEPAPMPKDLSEVDCSLGIMASHLESDEIERIEWRDRRLVAASLRRCQEYLRKHWCAQ